MIKETKMKLLGSEIKYIHDSTEPWTEFFLNGEELSRNSLLSILRDDEMYQYESYVYLFEDNDKLKDRVTITTL